MLGMSCSSVVPLTGLVCEAFPKTPTAVYIHAQKHPRELFT